MGQKFTGKVTSVKGKNSFAKKLSPVIKIPLGTNSLEANCATKISKWRGEAGSETLENGIKELFDRVSIIVPLHRMRGCDEGILRRINRR